MSYLIQTESTQPASWRLGIGITTSRLAVHLVDGECTVDTYSYSGPLADTWYDSTFVGALIAKDHLAAATVMTTVCEREGSGAAST
jgi:hypothetical protein